MPEPGSRRVFFALWPDAATACCTCWRNKQLAWAGCSEPPLPLLTLAGQLAERLGAEGLPIELRDFVAHVTLLRKARCVPLPEFEPFDWSVQDFVLVESKLSPQGARYTLIGRWPLTLA